MTPVEAERILRALVQAEVDFIVVGGVAAVLHGAPMLTRDLDIVHSRTPGNLERLLPVLRRLGARYRHRPEFVPELSHLASPAHQLLETDAGYLDLLGTVTGGATTRRSSRGRSRWISRAVAASSCSTSRA